MISDTCPKCGAEMFRDEEAGAWVCPDDDCGIAVFDAEITRAMILAGVEAFSEYDARFEGPEDAVLRIFQTMLRLRYVTSTC